MQLHQHQKLQAKDSKGVAKGAAWRLQSVASLCAVFFGFVVPASRVVLGYHTIEQVIVGSILGGAIGTMWAAALCSEAGCRISIKVEQCKFLSWFFQPKDSLKKRQL
jgi:hypothetical protein